MNILEKDITVKDLINLLNKKENIYSASGKERQLGISVNGECIGYVRYINLDGWGDGLVADVWLEIKAD